MHSMHVSYANTRIHTHIHLNKCMYVECFTGCCNLVVKIYKHTDTHFQIIKHLKIV